MKNTRTGYEVLSVTAAEMSSDPAAFDIPVDTDKIKGILERDKDPRFVTIQVAREGVSKNGRNYSAAPATAATQSAASGTVSSAGAQYVPS